MNCTAAIPVPVTLHRPWWARVADTLHLRWQGATAAPEVRAFADHDYQALSELSNATLCDIGAPTWIGERRELMRRIDLDLMRL